MLGLWRVDGALQHGVEVLRHVRGSTGGATVGLVGEGHVVVMCVAVAVGCVGDV